MFAFEELRSWVRGGTRRRTGESRRVQVVPGAIPRTPVESWILEILAARPECRRDQLVAGLAERFRRSEDPHLLSVLDEGFWKGWLWPVLAREELARLEGILWAIGEE